MKNIFLVVTLFLAVFVLVLTDFGKGNTVVYDCRDAHWMPDVPLAVKEECAKMRKEDWERLQQEGKKKLIST
jgi:hypothetical protein